MAKGSLRPPTLIGCASDKRGERIFSSAGGLLDHLKHWVSVVMSHIPGCGLSSVNPLNG